jgi:hypothetical protein
MPRIRGQIFINVQRGRAIVSRYLPFGKEDTTWEAAKNAVDLEPAAIKALTQQDIDLSITAHYCCPQELALQAEFDRSYQL